MGNVTSIGLVYGSVRERRMCDTVVGWVERQLFLRADLLLYVIDPAYPGTRAGIEGRNPKARADFLNRLGLCDGFIVVTPEFNHSFPAPLKALIDSASAEWAAKPVGFVSYGGIPGGQHAVEQLRLVFSERQAVGIGGAVSFANVSQAFDNNGEPLDKAGPVKALDAMLRRLVWWSNVLKQARTVQSCEEVAV